LVDNIVTNNFRGIYLIGSNDNVIARNVVEYSGSLAVLLESSNGNVVEDNTATTIVEQVKQMRDA
jgi:parallel beta-helix repeat protein